MSQAEEVSALSSEVSAIVDYEDMLERSAVKFEQAAAQARYDGHSLGDNRERDVLAYPVELLTRKSPDLFVRWAVRARNFKFTETGNIEDADYRDAYKVSGATGKLYFVI